MPRRGISGSGIRSDDSGCFCFSIAAENEAAHLKQLKKYIDRFIERVEASTSTECQKQKQNRYVSKDSVSTDSSEVRVDARKILDIVNNPFKTISSDVTINIAKKLTDALVQEKTSKDIRTHSSKPRKNLELETDEDRFPHSVGGITSGSGKLTPEIVRLKAEAFLRKANSFPIFTYGLLGFCGLLFIVNKCK